MASIHTLTTQMKELEDQLVVCMRCGMCQSVCPVFEQTGRESDVARGKLALLDGLMQEMFQDPEGIYERLNKCLLCGSCQANCPSGVSALEIFMKARAVLTGYMGLSPAKKAVLRGMLAHPGIFDRFMEWGARFQNLFTRPVNDVLGTSCARVMSPLIGERHFVPLAAEPFHRQIPSLRTEPGSSGIRVAFYVGCLLDKIFPRVATAALDVLRHHEIGVFLPAGQACCGIPAISSGDMKTFNRLVRHNVKLFESEPVDVILTACATCTSTIKEVWPRMMRDSSPDIMKSVESIAEKTQDISQFIVKALGLTPPADSTGGANCVTYHDPCHLKKSLGISKEPRTLIQSSANTRLIEMNEADKCCGMGGSFNLQYYEISRSIGRLKRENIINSGCSTVATSCPACMLQLSDMLSRSGDRVSVKHAIEIYSESLKSNGHAI